MRGSKSSSPTNGQEVRRRRGRPRLSSPKRSQPTIASDDSSGSETVESQRRNYNDQDDSRQHDKMDSVYDYVTEPTELPVTPSATNGLPAKRRRGRPRLSEQRSSMVTPSASARNVNDEQLSGNESASDVDPDARVTRSSAKRRKLNVSSLSKAQASDSESSVDSFIAEDGDLCLNGVFLARDDMILEQGPRRYFKALTLKSGLRVELGDFVYVESGEDDNDYIALVDRILSSANRNARRRCQVRCRWCFRNMEAVANDGSYFELGHDRAELMISDAFNLNAAHFIKGAVFVACLPAVTPEEKARFLEACQRRAPDEYFIRYAYLHEVGTRILLTRIPEDAMHPFRQYSVHLDNPLNKFIWDGLQERWSKLFPQGESDAGPEEESILAADLAVSADQSREETDRRLAKVALERLMRNKAAAAASAASSSSNSSVNLSVKSTMPAAERYSLAKHQLQLSTLPPKLQCRGEERKKVLEFLVSKLENTGEGGVMYIAGLPGTGKTATVLECVRTLQTAHELGECPPFQFVNVNGMALADPQQLYRIMYNALTGKAVVPAHAADMLEKLFSAQTAKRVCCVMLVDELDQIVAKGTRVVYNLVEWAIRPFSQLVVIGIANTMDLPERLLPRIASRFGTWRIQFAPYSQPQLVQILASRIEDAHVFEPSSIEFVSQKVAQLGDCRRALHLCSLAVDAAAREWRLSGKVSSSPVLVHVKHIDEALVQMALSARVTRTAVRDLPKLARRVMCQIANLSIVQTANLSNRSADSSLIRIDSVCDRVLSVYAAEKDRPSRADILRILHSPLAAMNLVQLVDVGPTTDEDTTASIKFRSAYASKSGLTVPLCVRLVSDVNDLQRWFADDPDPGCAIKDNMDGVRNW